MQNDLSAVQSSIKNLMKAIEAGIITETTRARLLELESEQTRLRGKIAAMQADIVPVDRDDLIAGLTMFRDGDVRSKKYQAKLFDTFLRAVYLYDDHLKIVFSFTGPTNAIDLPVSESDSISNFIDLDGEDFLGEKVRLDATLVHQIRKIRTFFLWEKGSDFLFSFGRYSYSVLLLKILQTSSPSPIKINTVLERFAFI